jgi:hypothetical protein
MQLLALEEWQLCNSIIDRLLWFCVKPIFHKQPKTGFTGNEASTRV